MSREKQLKLYKQFIENCTTVAKSVNNYSDFKRINECLRLLFPAKYDISVLDFDNIDEFRKITELLLKQEEFVKINDRGNNQYSNTLKYYLRFLYAKRLLSNKEKIVVEKFSINNNTPPLQTIYYGTPGSGKSHKVKELVSNIDENLVFRTTFHPDSDYASFVGCYKPVMENDNIKYKFTPQAFTKSYVKAWQNPDEPVYLIIEEINRGNCAQIFGDLFQLLDRKDGVSEYPIDADNDLKDYLVKVLGESHEGIANGKLKLPANLNIIATMNTSDQSLFPMDSAFKRRWSWKCVPIDYDNPDSEMFMISVANKSYKWHDFLKEVNQRIVKATDSEDKQMGNFFITHDVKEEEFVDKVMFYLWNDVCKEEFHTNNNFFRNYTDDKKTESKEFSFNELFGTDRTNVLLNFMSYLGIEPANVDDPAEEAKSEEQ